MISENKLYTWIDVQDAIIEHFKSADQKSLDFLNFRIYWDGINISRTDAVTESEVYEILEKTFLSRFQKNDDENSFSILLEGDRYIPIYMEKVSEDELDRIPFKPTLSRPPFVGAAMSIDLKQRMNQSMPAIYAFHSFKGGVGRTLHAMAMALNLSENQNVLFIDADFEAPGVSWLVNAQISFADMLALLHGADNEETAISLVADNLKVDEKEGGRLYIMPAFRSISEDAPSLEIKPEHIYKFSQEPFVLTDALVKLASKLNVSNIIIDLRAGLSELSSGWFFDPVVRKIFVTTLSSQSILGTAMMFRLLAKFDKQINLKSEDILLPSLIVSQIPKSSLADVEANWGDIYASKGPLQPLRTAYNDAFIKLAEYEKIDGYQDLTDEQIIGRVVGDVTLLSEEYDSLKTLSSNWEDVARQIRLTGLEKRLNKIIDMAPTQTIQTGKEDIVKLRKRLKDSAHNLIFAETERQDGFLKTGPIKNLILSFQNQLPIAIVVGAKGSGKTFLFKQIGFFKNWQKFGAEVSPNFNNHATILPVTLPANLQNVNDFNKTPTEIATLSHTKDDKNIWQEYIKPRIETALSLRLSVTQWREEWFDFIAWAAGYKVGNSNVGREFLFLIKENDTRIVAIFDGLEDQFKKFNTDEEQQKALESLLQDVPTWLESQSQRHLGLLVFVRKDIVTASIQQNTGQFLKKYESFELKWNVEEALRLIHWILNKHVLLESPTFPNWEKVLSEKTEDELIKPLHQLWGKRMAKDTSKEAFSHNWVLGSLANLKKEIQSRDIVRFLDSAAEKTISAPAQNVNLYSDRILIPTAIRDSIDEVGKNKIEEVKVENMPLKEILDVLEKNTSSVKFPCLPEVIRRVIPEQKGIQILEENGVIVLHNGEYYMAELYRRGMGFDYSRKGRPKVLYF